MFGLRILLGVATCISLFSKYFEYDFQGLTMYTPFLQRQPWSQVGGVAFVMLFLVLRRFHTGKFSSRLL